MKPILSLQQVTLAIEGVDKPLIAEFDYDIYAGDCVIVLGSNGSGKSSLLKLIDRRYRHTGGNIYFGSDRIDTLSPQQFSSEIKTLTQNCNDSLFMGMTVYENYLLVNKKQRRLITRHTQERAFLQNYLAKFNPRLPDKLDQLCQQLSGGEKQALALALTVLHPPKLLLLDEHTSALDPIAAEQIMQITQEVIREYRITCLLVTHDLTCIEQLGNKILALKNGKKHCEFDCTNTLNHTQTELLAACY